MEGKVIGFCPGQLIFTVVVSADHGEKDSLTRSRFYPVSVNLGLTLNTYQVI